MHILDKKIIKKKNKEYNLNQSKDNSFVERVAKNNS